MISEFLKKLMVKIKPMRIARFLKINPQFFFDVMLYHVSKLFNGNIDEKLIILGGANGKAFMGNTKYLYFYLRDNTDYKLYYFVKSKGLQKELSEQGINTIYAYSLEAIKILRKAHVIFVTHGYFDILPVKLSSRTLAIQTWHGADIKIIGQHSYMTKYIKSKKSTITRVKLREAQFFNYILTPSASEKPIKIIRDVFKFPPERILSIGYPRNDILFTKDSNLLKKLKKNYHIRDKIERIILYAPTYREVFTTKEPFNKEDLMKLNKLGAETNTVFLMKAHINEEIVSLENLDYVSTVRKEADIQELLLISDVLITDYSSVYCDYLLLNRPILLYAYDYDEYVSQRGIYYKHLEEIAPGPIIYNANDLIYAIKNIEKIGKEYQPKAMKLNNYFNKYKDGKSTERLLRFLKLIN